MNEDIYEPGTLGLLIDYTTCAVGGPVTLYRACDSAAAGKESANPFSVMNFGRAYKSLRTSEGQVVLLLNKEKLDGIQYLQLLAGDFVGWARLDHEAWSAMVEAFQRLPRTKIDPDLLNLS